MKTKHTEGKWYPVYSKLTTKNECSIFNTKIQGHGSKMICKINFANDNFIENYANIRLLAASSELLNSCLIAIKAFEELGIDKDQNCYKQVLNAIKKATE